MSKRRGLSVEEKRTRMMEFFYEKKDFFQLKELEKQCQKEKGITSMSVKDILQSLVDDGMVDTDKIGTCVYFWAFPSKASQKQKRKLDDISSKLSSSSEKKTRMEEAVKEAKVGREHSTQRTNIFADLEAAQQRRKEAVIEVDKKRECDPEVMQQMQEQTSTAKDAANRWTDNVFAIKSWIKKKFAFDDSVIDKQFEIPDDFDYLD